MADNDNDDDDDEDDEDIIEYDAEDDSNDAGYGERAIVAGMDDIEPDDDVPELAEPILLREFVDHLR